MTRFERNVFCTVTTKTSNDHKPPHTTVKEHKRAQITSKQLRTTNKPPQTTSDQPKTTTL